MITFLFMSPDTQKVMLLQPAVQAGIQSPACRPRAYSLPSLASLSHPSTLSTTKGHHTPYSVVWLPKELGFKSFFPNRQSQPLITGHRSTWYRKGTTTSPTGNEPSPEKREATNEGARSDYLPEAPIRLMGFKLVLRIPGSQPPIPGVSNASGSGLPQAEADRSLWELERTLGPWRFSRKPDHKIPK